MSAAPPKPITEELNKRLDALDEQRAAVLASIEKMATPITHEELEVFKREFMTELANAKAEVKAAIAESRNRPSADVVIPGAGVFTGISWDPTTAPTPWSPPPVGHSVEKALEQRKAQSQDLEDAVRQRDRALTSLLGPPVYVPSAETEPTRPGPGIVYQKGPSGAGTSRTGPCP
jgi:hypothetical protein